MDKLTKKMQHQAVIIGVAGVLVVFILLLMGHFMTAITAGLVTTGLLIFHLFTYMCIKAVRQVGYGIMVFMTSGFLGLVSMVFWYEARQCFNGDQSHLSVY